jgi:hypothetical protein
VPNSARYNRWDDRLGTESRALFLELGDAILAQTILDLRLVAVEDRPLESVHRRIAAEAARGAEEPRGVLV